MKIKNIIIVGFSLILVTGAGVLIFRNDQKSKTINNQSSNNNQRPPNPINILGLDFENTEGFESELKYLNYSNNSLDSEIQVKSLNSNILITINILDIPNQNVLNSSVESN
jgi:hypothetical protein